ncbi:MAG: heme lyase CcmF/NrfE family subunit, partial [Pseudomonadota bacterium]|nr:heme lyase CcmF/NrfE family subunit [Pseudomonadota bacterium]
ARWVRPWVLAAWCFLTIGITLGSFWAYYELGWGGWWFWDPVENASFMPWLLGTALLHSALVVENRQTLVNWTVLLGILTFSLSLVGTFLVRSGVLTSVHAFALDPGRGVFILALILLSSGGGLLLYALRAPGLARGPTFSPVSREGALVWNNILLVSAAATVFIGTFYPLAIDLVSRDKISVGPPYYNLTFVPIILPLLALMVAGPLLRWRTDTAGRVVHRTRWVALGLLAGSLGIWLFATTLLTAVGFGLAVWIVVGSLLALADRIQLGRVSWRQALGRAVQLPGAVWGMCVAHLGVGICVAGITAMSAFQEEAVLLLEPGAETTLAGYTFRLDEVAPAAGPNYRADQARFTVARNGVPVTTLISERRFYPVRRSQTTEAGIWSNGLINLYVSLGERSDTGAWAVRAYYHPLAPFIWVGALVMAGGGLLSLTDRRLRVGSPQRRVATALPPTGRELPTQPS